ncbi:hypothetical protein [Streptomyces sp. KMM 9044]|uniref:hypothetical protein n=1 Tax=Streptomyces sp. KMM 9044 TaxID=2744474 RepID=UPI002150AFA2|nr:hypothetical protein [Streptomyces sp. KMM 9044]WAX79889.1 hypothetical protein HUV60_021675 [Streptomyces sp. KMM 9044]
MPSDDASAPPSARTPAPTGASPTGAPPAGYRALLRNREFAGLYVGLTLTVAASTLSGFALGTLVDDRTGSPLLTAVSVYGATFATVLGALTPMSVADGHRPRRTLVTLQCRSPAGVAAQAVPGLPPAARFGLLLVLGFFQSLGTGTRWGLLADVVPASTYAVARSLMNITSGGTAVLGLAAALCLTPGTRITALAALSVAVTVLSRPSVARAGRHGARSRSSRAGPRVVGGGWTVMGWQREPRRRRDQPPHAPGAGRDGP